MGSRIAWKRRLGRLYRAMHTRDRERRLILLYHSVGGGREATAAQTLREHLSTAAALGQLLPLTTLLDSEPKRGVAVAITFDDGYATLRDQAADILAEFGAAATAFVNIGEIGDDERRLSNAADGYYPGEQFLDWRDVEALVAAGWQIGSHGIRHLDLVRADATTVKHEVADSKRELEARLGAACDLFAYTWGRSSPAVRAQVRAAGYRYGFAGEHSMLTPNSDPLALPRISVAKEYSAADVAAILRGDWDYLYWVGRAYAMAG
jgi:peptidoglycan/xylan/chitin deacetylase (PgdA/CDA1 family)